MKPLAVKQQGFTLLEVMIALTVFAIISALAWQILDGAMSTTAKTDARSAELNQLQRAWNLLERDFSQLQPRVARGQAEMFSVTESTLSYTTLNGISGQLRLERVMWQLHDHKLWRNIWSEMDAPAGSKPQPVPILSGVKSMHWRFWQGGWHEGWSDTSRLPAGAEVLLTMENDEVWRWVLTSPGEMVMPSTEESEESGGKNAEPEHPTAALTDADAPANAAKESTGGQP